MAIHSTVPTSTVLLTQSAYLAYKLSAFCCPVTLPCGQVSAQHPSAGRKPSLTAPVPKKLSLLCTTHDYCPASLTLEVSQGWCSVTGGIRYDVTFCSILALTWALGSRNWLGGSSVFHFCPTGMPRNWSIPLTNSLKKKPDTFSKHWEYSRNKTKPQLSGAFHFSGGDRQTT